MSAIAASTSLRERLNRLGGLPRAHAQPALEIPRGFERIETPFGPAFLREDVLAEIAPNELRVYQAAAESPASARKQTA